MRSSVCLISHQVGDLCHVISMMTTKQPVVPRSLSEPTKQMVALRAYEVRWCDILMMGLHVWVIKSHVIQLTFLEVRCNRTLVYATS
jgi:hypothetical protein